MPNRLHRSLGRPPGRWRRLRALVSVAAVGLAVAGCVNTHYEALEGCNYRVCNIKLDSCIRQVSRVVSCARGLEYEEPEVIEKTVDDIVAERSEVPPEELAARALYRRAHTLMGLAPATFDHEAETREYFEGVAGYYLLGEHEVVIVEDTNVERRDAYLTLVHEMVHAHQDQQYDLPQLEARYGPTLDRRLGLRALVEGEATWHTIQAMAQIERFDPVEGDWDETFATWRADALAQGEADPHALHSVWLLFPYAYGTSLVHDAMAQSAGDDLSVIHDLFDAPPDSTSAAMGLARGPNRDAALDPVGVPMLAGNYRYLGSVHLGVWLLQAMFHQTAKMGDMDHFVLPRIGADVLSMFHDPVRDHVMAVWRVRGVDAHTLPARMTRYEGTWWRSSALDGQPDPVALHSATAVDGDLVLVASEPRASGEAAPTILGWYSPMAAQQAFPFAAKGDSMGMLPSRSPFVRPTGPR